MARTCVYAGSFDPITVGHVDVIQRGLEMFDEVVVAVGNNPAKRYWFDISERERMTMKVIADFGDRVRVVSFKGLLVDVCQAEESSVILRGLRLLSDFEAEFKNGLANRDMTGVETMFLLTDPRYIFVSSSMVKDIAINGGDISKYVPSLVVDEIVNRARQC